MKADWYNNYCLPVNVNVDKIKLTIYENKDNDEENVIKNNIENQEKKYQQMKMFVDNLENITDIKEEKIKILFNLIEFLSHYIKFNNIIDKSYFKKILNHIHNLSKNEATKLKQNIQYKKSRNSYKFCQYCETCNFYYKNGKCENDHYVYNKVTEDINLLLKLTNKYPDKFNNNKNIVKFINTLLFVIDHMKTEYINKNCYN